MLKLTSDQSKSESKDSQLYIVCFKVSQLKDVGAVFCCMFLDCQGFGFVWRLFRARTFVSLHELQLQHQSCQIKKWWNPPPKSHLKWFLNHVFCYWWSEFIWIYQFKNRLDLLTELLTVTDFFKVAMLGRKDSVCINRGKSTARCQWLARPMAQTIPLKNGTSLLGQHQRYTASTKWCSLLLTSSFLHFSIISCIWFPLVSLAMPNFQNLSFSVRHVTQTSSFKRKWECPVTKQLSSSLQQIQRQRPSVQIGTTSGHCGPDVKVQLEALLTHLLMHRWSSEIQKSNGGVDLCRSFWNGDIFFLMVSAQHRNLLQEFDCSIKLVTWRMGGILQFVGWLISAHGREWLQWNWTIEVALGCSSWQKYIYIYIHAYM